MVDMLTPACQPGVKVFCIPRLCQAEQLQDLPERVVIVGTDLVVMSDTVLQSTERSPGLRSRDLILSTDILR